MFELLFLMAFSLHNLEVAVWLPKWSRYAKKFHVEVGENEFRFAFGGVSLFMILILKPLFKFGKKIISFE